MTLVIWTIGHSTRTIDEFVSVARTHDIEVVADVRRFPGSRRLPHFSAEPLAQHLATRGIDYIWIPALGGRRTPHPDSPNVGWRNKSFRGYADHLSTEEFADGFAELVTIASGARTAVMCSELLWWRCHRRLIADVLVASGDEVIHIRDAEHAEPHRLLPPAQVEGGVVRYPPA